MLLLALKNSHLTHNIIGQISIQQDQQQCLGNLSVAHLGTRIQWIYLYVNIILPLESKVFPVVSSL